MSDPVTAAPAAAPAATPAAAPAAPVTAAPSAPAAPVAAAPVAKTAAASLLTTDAAAPAAPAAAEPAAAVVADFKLPEYIKADTAQVAQFAAVFKDAGLPADKQQAIVDLWAKGEQARAAQTEKSHEAAWTKEQDALIAAVKGDPEIGGDKLKPTLVAAQKALLKYGNPKLNAVLDSSGLGNHPEIIRAFAKMGAALAEDSVAGAASAAASAVPDSKATLRAQYPSMAALIS